MKIIEVREGFVNFEADKDIYPSTFVEIDGMNKVYIAQVVRVQNFGEVCIAYANILFTVIDNELHIYDKTEPTKDADIKVFDYDILQDTIDVEKPIIVGKTLRDEKNIIMDSSAFNKKMLISADNPNVYNLLLQNISKQFKNIGKIPIIIDTVGNIKGKKYFAGVDFKFPIDKYTLTFMYQSCLNDSTNDSKMIISEIFKDLSEYADTVPFVPFQTLKSIVDDFVDKQFVFKLFVLKNKLAKFDKLGYFATNAEEVKNIENILSTETPIIDISKLDVQFQNYYLSHIYRHIDINKSQVFLELSNTISKKSLKEVMIDSDVPTTFLAHTSFKYFSDIKKMFDNFILEGSAENNSLFHVYSNFIEAMGGNAYLTVGEGVNYMPLISKVKVIDDLISYRQESLENTVLLTDDETEESDTFEHNKEYKDDTYSEEPSENDYEDIVPAQEITQTELEQAADIEIQQEVSDEENIDKVADIADDDVDNIVDDKVTDDTDGITDDNGVTDAFDENNQDNVTDEPKKVVTKEELIANIEEKSEQAINAVANDIKNVEQSEMFGDDNLADDDGAKDQVLESEKNELQEEKDVIEAEYVVNSKEISEPNNNSSDELELSEDVSDNELLESSSGELTEYETLNEINSDELESVGQNEELLIEEGTIENNLDLEIQSDELSEFELEDSNSSFDTAVELNDNDSALLADMSNADLDINDGQELSDVVNNDTQVMPIEEEDATQDFDEIIELDSTEGMESDIIVDMADEEDIIIDEEHDRQIVEDVNKVYTTMKESDELDEFSDSDLDFIDTLNNDDEDPLEELAKELQNDSEVSIDDSVIGHPKESVVPERQARMEDNNAEILEKRDASTPIVPVYDADIPQEDLVVSDSIQQGDSVIHAKYGNGIVEKMIKYGNKTLLSINFENVGRRLLDPTLQEIKKV